MGLVGIALVVGVNYAVGPVNMFGVEEFDEMGGGLPTPMEERLIDDMTYERTTTGNEAAFNADGSGAVNRILEERGRSLWLGTGSKVVSPSGQAIVRNIRKPA